MKAVYLLSAFLVCVTAVVGAIWLLIAFYVEPVASFGGLWVFVFLLIFALASGVCALVSVLELMVLFFERLK